jgi:hypothetical protein
MPEAPKVAAVTKSPSAAAYRTALAVLVSMMRDGATPRDVAVYVQSLAYGFGAVGVSHFIEAHAEPGTFAEAVFAILCGDAA